jgi:hypothetical protein
MGWKSNFFLIILVISLFATTGTLNLNKIRFLDDRITDLNDLEVHTSVVNNVYDLDKNRYEKLKDVKVKIYFEDLGFLLKTNSFDIDKNSNTGNLMRFDDYTIPPGEYLIRFTASNDDYRSRKFRYLTIE